MWVNKSTAAGPGYAPPMHMRNPASALWQESSYAMQRRFSLLAVRVLYTLEPYMN
jgi:hypothetical protein